MTASVAPPTDSLRPDERPLAEYRAVSLTAIAALLLGFASALTLVNPLLSIVPLAAIACSAIALRAIATSDGQLVGRRLALAGLCLATLMLGWGLAQYTVRQAALVTQAQRVGEGWLALVRQGEIQAAHQLMQPPAQRLSSEEATAKHYEMNEEARKNLQAFVSGTPIKEFITLGPDASFRYDSVAAQYREGFMDHVVLKYTFAGARESSATTPIWITVMRSVDEKTRQAEWTIRSADARAP